MPNRFEIVKGDITQQHVDAIVNAANTSLLGGGGVDGAIHRAAGKQLLEECRKIGGCPTGQARITLAYNIPVKKIVHTVGPVWAGGGHNEKELLASCYRSSLLLAIQQHLKTLAFPSIGTGAYRFPLEQAAPIAVTEIKKFLEGDKTLSKVLIVCFDDRTYAAYTEQLRHS